MTSKNQNHNFLYSTDDVDLNLKTIIQQEIDKHKESPEYAQMTSLLSGTSVDDAISLTQEEGPWTYMAAVLRKIDAEVETYQEREKQLINDQKKIAEMNLNKQHAKELEALKASQQQEMETLNESHKTQIKEQIESHKVERTNFESNAQNEIKTLKSKFQAELQEAKNTHKKERKSEWESFIANLSVKTDDKPESIVDKQAREKAELTLRHAEELQKLEREYQENLKLSPSDATELRANYLFERDELIDTHKEEIKNQKFMHRQELRDISVKEVDVHKNQKSEILDSIKLSYKANLAELQSTTVASRKDLKSRQTDQQAELVLKIAENMASFIIQKQQQLDETLSRHEKETSSLKFMDFKMHMPSPKKPADEDEYSNKYAPKK